MGPSWLSSMQWNLSIEGTAGTQLAVLYREMSLIQRLICAQLYVVGTADTVLIGDVSSTRSVLYREVPLYFPCPPVVRGGMVSCGNRSFPL